jgi:hypothetical protein
MEERDVAIKLTWDDLLIEDPTLDFQRLLADWKWLLQGQYRVVAGTKFGDWFIERPNGAVEILDATDGSLRQLAESTAAFRASINTQARQEEWLLSLLVLSLHEKGVIPGPGQCYGFKIPLILGGKAITDNVQVMDLVVWVSLCGQLHEQLSRLPPGGRITGFEVQE